MDEHAGPRLVPARRSTDFGIPYDLIYKEQVTQGDLRGQYDVILMAAQNITRQAVLQAPSARPQPYQKSDKYKFLGMYGETPDMSGGFGQDGVDAFAKFLEGGGTLIAAAAAARFPIEFGWAHTVDAEPITGVTAQRPDRAGGDRQARAPGVLRVHGEDDPDQVQRAGSRCASASRTRRTCSRATSGGDSSVLSGAMVGRRPVAGRRRSPSTSPTPTTARGACILFANNPIYRWQNHGEFNMVFNSLLNWSYVPGR